MSSFKQLLLLHLTFLLKLSVTTYLILASAYLLTGQTDSDIYLQDCATCPEMATIPSGSVMIGSHHNEIDRKRAERDQREITINQAVALSKIEVTIAQFKELMTATNHQSIIPKRDGQPLIGCKYCDDTSYGYIRAHGWENPGYPQRENALIVCVSWGDAIAFAAWISKKTGREYIIPLFSEIEYASRAGTETVWYWSNESAKACEYANIGDRSFALQYPS